ncbi:MAG TPA: LPS export ABC transporter periplasmic protein LptC [Dongiaceae bacterium]|nr:LPS export ABC transporter periplasmic protein LptC [Dongiaceae bacterium]
MTIHRRACSRRGAVWTALLCAAVVVGGCSRSRTGSPVGSCGELPDQEVTDFVLTETDQGRPQWTLYARYAATYQAKNLVISRDIRVDFFDDKGARSSELTAHEGEIQQQTRDMTARGNVVLQTTEGTRMTTEELHFLNAQQLITSDRLVRVDRQGDVLEGIGFSSDPGLHHFEFRTQVHATVHGRPGALPPAKGEAR